MHYFASLIILTIVVGIAVVDIGLYRLNHLLRLRLGDSGGGLLLLIIILILSGQLTLQVARAQLRLRLVIKLIGATHLLQPLVQLGFPSSGGFLDVVFGVNG